jgi:putative SOS response-associated peptidase YedK
MCNDYANHVPWSAYVEAFSEINLPVILPKAALNLEPRHDIWPTDVAPLVRRTEGGGELAQLRWDGVLSGDDKLNPCRAGFRAGRRHMHRFFAGNAQQRIWNYRNLDIGDLCIAQARNRV